MAARGRRATDPDLTSSPTDLAARRLTPVDSAALSDLAAKVDRLLAMVETGDPIPVAAPATGEAARPGGRDETELARQVQASLDGLIERLAGETVNLRDGLQLALDDVRRRQAQERDALRAAVDAGLQEVLQRQAEDTRVLQAQLQAALAEAREQFRADLRVLATQVATQLADQRADGQQQLRAAFDASLAEQRVRSDIAEVREALEAVRSAVGSVGDDTRHQLAADVNAVIASRDQRLGALLAEQLLGVQSQLRAALDEVLRRQAHGWEARRAELEAALADGNEQLQRALAEENARLRALEAALLGQASQTRLQWRADLEAALTAGRDVAVALVTQATGRLVAMGDELAASIAKAAEERGQEQAEQLNDLQAAFEDLTSAIGLERRELRAAVEAGLDTSELVERLDALTAETAKGAAEVAASINKLRRQPRSDSRVADTLMELYEELERLRRKVPARAELRLADDQVAAIVAAVRAARPRPSPSPKPTPPKRRSS